MTTQATQNTFKVGDTVLCPHWDMNSYIIEESGVKDFPLAICGQFAPEYENSYFCFDENGINTLLQAVFHDTPANRQAIATLYHGEPAKEPTQNQFCPNYFELKHGFYENGVFHCPAFAIFRNGERMVLGGVIKVSYPYSQANHIVMHLQEVSSDTFTLEPVMWQPMPDYVEAVA